MNSASVRPVRLVLLLLSLSLSPAHGQTPSPEPSASSISGDTASPAPVAASPSPVNTPSWLDRVNAAAPGSFPAQRSFQASYRLVYTGLEAGRAEVNSTVSASTGQISTRISGGTVGLARTLYQVDGTHHTVADLRTLRPLRLDQTETDSKRRKTSHVDFTVAEAQRTLDVVDRKTNQSTNEGARKRVFRYPGMYDMHSALLYMRSLPLAVGEARTMIVMTAGNPYLATIKVVGREPVKTTAGTYPAIACSLALVRINKKGDLEPFKAFKTAKIWLSDDADRMIVKAEAQVFVGTVTLDLAKVSFASK